MNPEVRLHLHCSLLVLEKLQVQLPPFFPPPEQGNPHYRVGSEGWVPGDTRGFWSH